MGAKKTEKLLNNINDHSTSDDNEADCVCLLIQNFIPINLDTVKKMSNFTCKELKELFSSDKSGTTFDE